MSTSYEIRSVVKASSWGKRVMLSVQMNCCPPSFRDTEKKRKRNIIIYYYYYDDYIDEDALSFYSTPQEIKQYLKRPPDKLRLH